MFTCASCHKSFRAGRSALEEHCRATGHPLPFSCDTCTASFALKESCEQHMDAKGHRATSPSSLSGALIDTFSQPGRPRTPAASGIDPLKPSSGKSYAAVLAGRANSTHQESPDKHQPAATTGKSDRFAGNNMNIAGDNHKIPDSGNDGEDLFESDSDTSTGGDVSDLPKVPLSSLGDEDAYDDFYARVAARGGYDNSAEKDAWNGSGSNGDDALKSTGEDDAEKTFWCVGCWKRFDNLRECADHEAVVHNYCRPCERMFSNALDFATHLNSPAHQDATVPCPFCEVKFTTVAGVVHHIESTTCEVRPNLNDDEVYRMIRARDKFDVLTKAPRDGKMPRLTQEEVNEEESWTGHGYQCLLCGKEFKGVVALQQHMDSAVHRQHLYRCPSIWCCAEFKKFSAVVNHLESGTCKYMKPSQVERFVRDIFTRNRPLYRLRRRDTRGKH
ncbi:hypothetical protein VTJ49DRAFT_447 [Mycothermus thermophilus]|uniref:C2H2-type domain-containing protein n=1 Tax=Humicola insolens TaxID=85995 RepID=A0ABR3VF12_HUMIN